jgi:putative transposase
LVLKALEDWITPPSSLRCAVSSHEMPWPHASTHQLGSRGTYFVTASTLHCAHHFKGKERLAVLHRGVLKVATEFGWRLEAWAVFSNHYHFVAQSPELEVDATSLRRMLGLLHEQTAKWVMARVIWAAESASRILDCAGR